MDLLNKHAFWLEKGGFCCTVENKLSAFVMSKNHVAKGHSFQGHIRDIFTAHVKPIMSLRCGHCFDAVKVLFVAEKSAYTVKSGSCF